MTTLPRGRCLGDRGEASTRPTAWVYIIFFSKTHQNSNFTLLIIIIAIRGWRGWWSTSWRSSVKSRLRFHRRRALPPSSRLGHMGEMSLKVVFVHLNEVGHPLDRVLQGMHRLLRLWPTYVLCFFCVSANEAACKPANFKLSKRCLTTLAMMMALKRVRMWYDDDTVEAHQGGTSTTPLRVTCCRRQSINGCTWGGCCWQSDHTKPWWNISTIMKIILCLT